MPQKWPSRNPLTLSDRKKLKEGLDMNLSYRQLANHIGRTKSTAMFEAKRLGSYKDYDPEKAQKDYEKKAKRALKGVKKDNANNQ